MVLQRDLFINFLLVVSSIIAERSLAGFRRWTHVRFFTLRVACQNGFPLQVIAVY